MIIRKATAPEEAPEETQEPAPEVTVPPVSPEVLKDLPFLEAPQAPVPIADIVKMACDTIAKANSGDVTAIKDFWEDSGKDELMQSAQQVLDMVAEDGGTIDLTAAGVMVYELFPRGKCSGLGFALKELENAKKGDAIGCSVLRPLYVAAGLDCEAAGEETELLPITSCRIESDEDVGGYAWPEGDRDPVGKLGRGDSIAVYGTIKLEGEGEYYVTRGKLEDRVGGIDFDIVRPFGPTGIMYIPVDTVQGAGDCGSVPNFSELGLTEVLEEPSEDSDELMPMIIDVSETSNCRFNYDGFRLKLCSDVSQESCTSRYLGSSHRKNWKVEKITDDGRIYASTQREGINVEGWLPSLQGKREANGELIYSHMSLESFSGLDLDACLKDF